MLDNSVSVTEKTLRQIVLSRYYLSLVKNELRFPGQTSQYAAVNLLHEALESYIISAAEHVNAQFKSSASLEAILEAITVATENNPIPSKSVLLQFNKLRVSAKHYLIAPDRDQVSAFYESVVNAMRIMSRLYFFRELESFSLYALLRDQEHVANFAAAEAAVHANQYQDALFYVRKSIYKSFENSYDISAFYDENVAAQRGLLSTWSMCRAPSHVKNPEYIRENVRTPLDYIVLDHAKITSELLEDGIDPQTYWNV